MKLHQFAIGMVSCLSLAVASHAQTNTVDWKFSVAGNPSAPTTSTTTNVATATFVSGNNSYFFGTGPEGLYGSPTGLWSMARLNQGEAVLELKLAETVPATTADLSLVLTHFVDSGAFFPGTVSFSLANAIYEGRTEVVPQTGDMVGAWFADTYRWDDVSFPLEIALEISPGEGNGSLFIDEVLFTISGELVPIPEPMSIQLAAAGLLVFGVGTWLRRRQKA